MKMFVKLTGVLVMAALLLSIVPGAAFSGYMATDTSFTLGTAAGSGSSGNQSTVTKSSAGGKTDNSIILYVGSPVAYVNGVEKKIDDTNPEVTPVVIDQVEMVPVRFIAESLGGSVRWNAKTLTATVILGNKTYQFTQGSTTMLSGDVRYSLDAAVQAYNGRTFVPLDKFARILGKSAFYDRGLVIISSDGAVFDKEKDKEQIDTWISKLSYLPVVGSREKLLRLLQEGERINGLLRGSLVKSKQNDIANTMQSAGKADEAAAAVAQATVSDGASKAGDGYSTTNVQVKGVDEGDIVKTDGNYIYQVNKQRVIILKAAPPENMKVMSTISVTDKDMVPLEIYLHGDRLVIIGSSQAYLPMYKENSIKAQRRLMSSTTKVLIYDISIRADVKLLREVELEGGYVSSRRIGSSLYLIANDYLDYHRIQSGETDITPAYRDTKLKNEYHTVGLDSIRYFPGMVESNYMVVAGIGIDGNEAADISVYLGSGQNIYASGENLYVAVSNYTKASLGNYYEDSTQIYKFGMKNAKLTYLCKGSVPGTVLNQFSMDEQNGWFRIATTKGNVRATGERISKNALYVLDSMLSTAGRLEDIAPGEKIYSVRFMGDRAYVVTFKTVDPLFVIDLKNPAKPTVLGALKIPGYSDYLHPYDENHIIGFGKDTVEIKGQAYYLGMKIALFDVSDVTKPVQKFSEIIGDRGTDSELLQNHKALLFSKERNLLVFPVTLMEKMNNSDKTRADSLEYGQFTFQGAMVYQLDLKNGFKLKGRITHLSKEDYMKAGNNWYDSDKNISRIIYIGDNLYTLSNAMIKASSIADLKEKGSVVIP